MKLFTTSSKITVDDKSKTVTETKTYLLGFIFIGKVTKTEFK